MMIAGVGVDMFMQSSRAFTVENAYAKRNAVQLVFQVEIMAAQFLCIMWAAIYDAYKRNSGSMFPNISLPRVIIVLRLMRLICAD